MYNTMLNTQQNEKFYYIESNFINFISFIKSDNFFEV